MRVKLCFLYFWAPSSLSKWKACQISCWEGDTQIMCPQTSPAPHACTEESCCCSCMFLKFWGNRGNFTVFLKCSWCSQWDSGSHISNSSLQRMQGLGAGAQPHTAEQGCATKTLSLHRSSSMGTEQAQTQSHTSTAGQECRRTAGPWSLP